MTTKAKAANFSWAYNGAQLRHDPVMTRARAAKMLRAWRQHGYNVTREHTDSAQVWTVKTGGLLASMALNRARMSGTPTTIGGTPC